MKSKAALSIACLSFMVFIGCANNKQISSPTDAGVKSCSITYQNYSTKDLCDTYWDNKNSQCDFEIAKLIRGRGQIDTPRSLCGQIVNKLNVNSCNLNNISELSSDALCNTYYSSSNCNNEIISELTKRNLKSAPKSECGLIANSKPISLPINVSTDNKQCQIYINKIFADGNLLKTACFERYKSVRDETILCRQELNTLITANSNGVGKNFETCGSPILTTPLLASDAKISSYREITSYTPIAIQNYLSQFNESKRNLCTRMNANNDFDGTFCLYILDRIKKDFNSSHQYLLKAADFAHLIALFRVYQIAKGENDEKANEIMFSSLRQSAQLGNIDAAIDLGWIYLDKVPKNYQKGLFWSEVAANAGHGEGASNIGLIYHKGLGVKVNFILAKYWYERSMNMEKYWSGQSHVGLGVLYMNGSGVPKNLNEAKQLFKFVINDMPKASKESKNLATMYLNKIGG